MKQITLAAATLLCAAAVQAADIEVDDAYARVSTSKSKSGAVFMVIRNTGDAQDRLVSADTDIAARTELHTHLEEGEGIMRMVEVEEGFAVEANGTHALARGGDHVMLMGLNTSLQHGDQFTLTLHFEKAGEMDLVVPVDLERMPEKHMHGTDDTTGGHDGHDMNAHDHDMTESDSHGDEAHDVGKSHGSE